MKKASIITLIVTTALLLYVAPAAALSLQDWHARISPYLDPMVSAPTRGMVIGAYTEQGYDNGWQDYYRMEATYNAQGRCAIALQSNWIDSTSVWETVMRLVYTYRPDGRPLRADWQSPTADGWENSAYTLWLYAGDRLISIVTNQITDEGELPYYQVHYNYSQETGRIADIVEAFYMLGEVNPGRNKHVYEWDSQGRQSVIQDYHLYEDDVDWVRGYQYQITYRPEDTSNYWDHLRTLELFMPCVPSFTTGLNPFLVADRTMIGFYPGDTSYVNQTTHYLYHTDMRLDRIQTFFGDLDDTLYHENDFTYANGQISSQTTTYLDFPSSEMIPEGRTLYEYLDIVETDDPAVPAQVTSISVYPNPFNPSATISYTLREADQVKLDVFNLKGQKVRVLEEGFQTTGTHSLTWDGTDRSGNVLPSGVYFLRISSGNDTKTAKAVLAK